MCGISGFNWKNEEGIRKMSSTISHRGPDASGFFCDEGISFGHNRLSIIDLSVEANQPMFDQERNLAITYNGEIYNFKELKKELAPYPFKTESDTEVILAGYKKWGKGVVEKLNGMFAFAIWDKAKKELFMARDRSGIKPLYYYFEENRLIFASEIKAILSHSFVPRMLNKEAFNYFMRVLYVPAPLTMIKGISKLPPGSILSLKQDNLSIESYIRGSESKENVPYDAAKRELRERTLEAIKGQLVSDVPVGVYLSGGIDSSVVLFAMSQFQKNIKTFSVGFDLTTQEEKEKFNYDFELAKKTADFFGVDHHPLTMSGGDAAAVFNEMVEQNDDPISNPTALAMMFLAKKAKKDVTVVLTGNGGDELFGGYERYRLSLISSYYKKLPSFLRKIGNVNSTLRKLNTKEDIDLYARFMFEKDDKLTRIISSKFFEKDNYIKEYFFDRYFSKLSGDRVNKFMETDRISWLPEQALALADKMSMKSALEERVPLLDNELIDFAKILPRHYKVTSFETKKIFKDAFRNDLPPDLFNQPKRGWFAPGAKWLRHPEITQIANEALSQGYYIGTKDLFNWQEVERMLENHISKKEYNLTPIWAVLTFQCWAKTNRIIL